MWCVLGICDIGSDSQLAKRKVELGNFFRALRWNNQHQCPCVNKGVRKTYIDGYEFKKAILGHYGDYHLVAGLVIVVEEGETACVGLNEKGGRLVE